MKSTRLTTRLLPLLAAFALLGSAHAQNTAVPDYLSYQGRALNADGTTIGSGTPVNRTVTFRVWDHPSNSLVANLIYSEQQVVTISNGEFSALIGAGAATTGTPLGYSESTKGVPTVKISSDAVFGAATRYLGVTIDDGTAAVDNEISPRQQFVTSSYAFRAKVAESVGANAISSDMLATGAVGSTQLAAASVTNAKLGTNAVLTANIGDLNVTTGKIADANVTTAKIADLNVTTAKLADSAVTTAKIADANVTTATLADSAVTTAKIADLNVTTAKLADASVTGAKIASATIAEADLATGAVTSTGILDGTIATADLANNSVTGTKIVDATVSNADIALGTITADNLGTNTVTTVGNLRIIRGTVTKNGAITAGSGFTVGPVNSADTQITINFTTAFSGTPTIMISNPIINNERDAGTTVLFSVGRTTSSVKIEGYSVQHSYHRAGFDFIAIGPR